MEEILASVQVRRDTKANWETINPILLEGEAAYELDTDMFKIGDGIKHYSDLPYHNKVGPQGPQGEPGPTPQISMNVSTGNPGTSASVSITGTAENPVINLTVPRGDTGKTGSTGPKGDTGNSGVYIGTSQPTDSNINVWIDSDGEPTEVIDDFAREGIGKLKDDIDNLSVSGKGEDMTCFFDKAQSSNLFDKTQALTEHSQIESDGTIITNSLWTSVVTYYIPVNGLGTDNYRAYNRLGGNFKIAEYKADKSFNSNTSVRIISNNTLFSLDENTAYVTFEIYTAYLDSMMFGVYPDIIIEYIPYTKEYSLKEKYIEKYLPQVDLFETPIVKGNLNSNTNLVIDFSDVRKNCTFAFFGTVSSFESVEFRLGENNGYASWLVIDGTKIQNYYLNKNSLIEEFQHGLSIGNVFGLSVKITEELDSTKHALMADVCLNSDTGVYRTRIKTYGGFGKVKAFTQNSSFNDCTMSVWCNDFSVCDVWGYGDSYFDTWTIYSLAGDGKLNMLMDNYTGRGSVSAFESLKKSLKCAIPKKLLWCMGMNDADSADAVNSNWMITYNNLVSICEKYSIELILCTIPNVPERNHNFKNAIIRESGYRYADVSKAVGADVTTSWYDGLLSSDGVHPNGIKGATVIMAEIFSVVPEIAL